MSEESGVTREQAEALRAELERDAKEHGYHLNSDRDFTRDLAEGLLVNERRFGYRSCPCRLASGEAAADLDIVCPCDYRDPDLEEWGACYCALYVSQEVLDGTRELTPVPERRPVDGPRRSLAPALMVRFLVIPWLAGTVNTSPLAANTTRSPLGERSALVTLFEASFISVLLKA